MTIKKKRTRQQHIATIVLGLTVGLLLVALFISTSFWSAILLVAGFAVMCWLARWEQTRQAQLLREHGWRKCAKCSGRGRVYHADLDQTKTK